MLLEDVYSDLPLGPKDPARCKEVDPELFFSDKRSDKQAAIAICHKCESETKCAEWAVQTKHLGGVWGGMTKGTRRRIRKQQRSISRAKETIEERERAS